MNIINHPLSGFALLLLFFLYLVFSVSRIKFSKGRKCHKCKKGRMQEAEIEPRMMNFADRGSSFGLGARSHNKSTVITKVTYKCHSCLEFITVEENR